MSKVVLSESALDHINERRKRKFNPDGWEESVRKNLKNSGQPYIAKNGAHHVAIPQPNENVIICSATCTHPGCHLLLDRKIAIFDMFWASESYNLQTMILQCFMRRVPVNERKVANADLSRTQATYQYFLPDDLGIQLRVCMKTFMNVFGISKKRIEVLQKKISTGSILHLDKRGTHNNRPRKLADDVKQAILDHILSFPSYLGHYSRQEVNPLQQFLSPDLSISKMFRLFNDATGPEADSWEWIYRVMFQRSGLKFGNIRSDTCDLCDRLFIKIQTLNEEIPAEVEQLEFLWQTVVEHHHHAEKAYGLLGADREISADDPSYYTICVDLQGILLSPALTHGEFYYQRKFMTYNFAITEPASDLSTMCTWNQNEAKRGSREMTSCLLKYFTNKFQILAHGQARTLAIWSDRCAGQNNNYNMVCLFKYLIRLGYFTEIIQCFLITGHSFLPWQFALIENHRKGENIYNPEDWIQIIKETSDQFSIQEMKQNDFVDTQLLQVAYPRPDTLKISKVAQVRVAAGYPNLIYTKTNHDNQDWEIHEIAHYNEFLIPENLPILYNNPIPLPQLLIKDLQKMQQYIPHEKRGPWAFLPPLENQDQVVPI